MGRVVCVQVACVCGARVLVEGIHEQEKILCRLIQNHATSIAFAITFVFVEVASIRQHLASIYEKEEDWRNAAQVLVGIPLETGQK